MEGAQPTTESSLKSAVLSPVNDAKDSPRGKRRRRHHTFDDGEESPLLSSSDSISARKHRPISSKNANNTSSPLAVASKRSPSARQNKRSHAEYIDHDIATNYHSVIGVLSPARSNNIRVPDADSKVPARRVLFGPSSPSRNVHHPTNENDPLSPVDANNISDDEVDAVVARAATQSREDIGHLLSNHYQESISLEEDEALVLPTHSNLPKCSDDIHTTLEDHSFGNADFQHAFIDVVSRPDPSSTFRTYLGEDLKGLCDLYAKVKRDPFAFDAIELQTDFNQGRKVTNEQMKNVLPPEYHGRINEGHDFDARIGLLIELAYSPIGTEQINLHCMPFKQHCIAIMMKSLPHFFHYEYNGEWSDATYEDMIKCNDLAALTAEKTDTYSGLLDQYEEHAKLLGLKSMYEYFLINARNTIRHTILHMVANRDEPTRKLNQLVASHSTAKEIYGLRGKIRFSREHTLYAKVIRLTLHAQAWGMGMNKSVKLFGVDIRQLMSSFAFMSYARVIGIPDEEAAKFQSKIMDKFGREYFEGIDVGVMSHLAAELAKFNFNITQLDPACRMAFDSQLEVHGTMEKLMGLLKRFRAGHRLSTLASQLPVAILEPNYALSMVEECFLREVKCLAKTLRKKEGDILKRCRRIKKAQKKHGMRLGTMNKLAARKKRVSSITPEEVKLLGGEEAATKAIRNTKRAQDKSGVRLSTMHKRASQLKPGETLPKSTTPEEIKLLGGEEAAAKAIRNTSQAQGKNGVRLTTMNKLAARKKPGETLPKSITPEDVKLLGGEEAAIKAICNTRRAQLNCRSEERSDKTIETKKKKAAEFQRKWDADAEQRYEHNRHFWTQQSKPTLQLPTTGFDIFHAGDNPEYYNAYIAANREHILSTKREWQAKKAAAEAPAKNEHAMRVIQRLEEEKRIREQNQPVTIIVTKPSKATKLGLGISREARTNEIMLICAIHPGSLFEATDLRVGMIVSSINSKTYSTFEEGLALLKDAEGELHLVAQSSK